MNESYNYKTNNNINNINNNDKNKKILRQLGYRYGYSVTYNFKTFRLETSVAFKY